MPIPPFSTLRAAMRLRRRADVCEDLASALDSGLPAEAVLATMQDIGSGDGFSARSAPIPTPADGLATPIAAEFGLDRIDTATLVAAEKAGALSGALRELAADSRIGASLRMSVLKKLSYPCFLLLVATFVVLLLRSIGMSQSVVPLLLGVGVPAAVVGAAAWFVFRVRSNPGFDAARRLPLIGRVVQDAGEVAYLRALRRLYGAGIRIDEAHRTALTASPVASVRARLAIAAQEPTEGGPLVEALERSGALHRETIAMLRPAQKTGELEDALGRAVERRTFSMNAGLERLIAATSAVVSVTVIVTIFAILLEFYSGLLGALQRS